MPQKQRGKARLRAAIISGVLCMVTVLWAGCDGGRSPAKILPPALHKLGDITLRGNDASSLLSPTALVSPGPPPVFTPEGAADPVGMGTAAHPPIEKKEPEPIAETAPDTAAGSPRAGSFTIQIGAYIVDKNLAHIKEKVVSLGFSPYVKEMREKMRMFCVIVGAGLSEKDARETVSVLSTKGFDARPLPGDKGMVDVAAGIYYYRDDALAAEGEVRALGYTPRVEERTVEVDLKRLRVGAYGTIDEAKKDLSVLHQKGFSPVILKSDQ